MSAIMHESSLSSLSSSVCLFVALDDLDPVSGSRLSRELESVMQSQQSLASLNLLPLFFLLSWDQAVRRIRTHVQQVVFSVRRGRRQMRSRRRKCFFFLK